MWKDASWLVLDSETSGLDPTKDRIIEVGYCWVKQREIVGGGSWLINPELESLPSIISEITKITHVELLTSPPFRHYLPELTTMATHADLLMAYHAPFDRGFYSNEFERSGHIFPDKSWLDPCVWVKHFDKFEKGKKLSEAAKRRGISVEGAHRAQADTIMAAKVALTLLDKLPDDLSSTLQLQSIWERQQEADYRAWKAKQSKTVSK